MHSSIVVCCSVMQCSPPPPRLVVSCRSLPSLVGSSHISSHILPHATRTPHEYCSLPTPSDVLICAAACPLPLCLCLCLILPRFVSPPLVLALPCLVLSCRPRRPVEPPLARRSVTASKRHYGGMGMRRPARWLVDLTVLLRVVHACAAGRSRWL